MYQFYYYLHKLYFPVFLSVGCIVYGLKMSQIVLPNFVNSYLNDLLCIPIVLYISQSMVRIIKDNTTLRLPILLQLTVTTGYAIYFELILPPLLERYTADLWDVGCYFVGWFFFYRMNQIPSFEIKEKEAV